MENRARSFMASLKNAGYNVVWRPKKALVPWATIGDLPASAADMLMVIFRELGGVPVAPKLAPKHWDMQADGVLIEFDEALHFNRYRDLTLETPWSHHLPWAEAYGHLAESMEGMCLRDGGYGGKWANKYSDKMFGGSDDPGVLGPLGPSRWKQRAIYDALKDAYALYSPGVALARVSIHDEIGGLNVNKATKNGILLDPTSLRAFVQARTVPAAAGS